MPNSIQKMTAQIGDLQDITNVVRRKLQQMPKCYNWHISTQITRHMLVGQTTGNSPASSMICGRLAQGMLDTGTMLCLQITPAGDYIEQPPQPQLEYLITLRKYASTLAQKFVSSASEASQVFTDHCHTETGIPP